MDEFESSSCSYVPLYEGDLVAHQSGGKHMVVLMHTETQVNKRGDIYDFFFVLCSNGTVRRFGFLKKGSAWKVL